MSASNKRTDRAAGATRHAGAAAIFIAACALLSGCSGPTTGSDTPRLALPQAAATPVVQRVAATSDGPRILSAPAAEASIAASLPVLESHATGSIAEPELGTASDGGYHAYPAN